MAKKKKQNMLKDALILCAISLIAALALGFVNELTKDRIAQLEAEKKAAAYREVFPEMASIVDASSNEILAKVQEDSAQILADGGFSNTTINEICLVQDASGATIGYVASVSTKAYDAMTLTFGYTVDGTITGLSFLEIKETPGIGMKADLPDFKNQFAGNKADKLVSVKNGAGAGEINAISGATYTTDGVINGVNAGIHVIHVMKELQSRLGGAN